MRSAEQKMLNTMSGDKWRSDRRKKISIEYSMIMTFGCQMKCDVILFASG